MPFKRNFYGTILDRIFLIWSDVIQVLSASSGRAIIRRSFYQFSEQNIQTGNVIPFVHREHSSLRILERYCINNAMTNVAYGEMQFLNKASC